MESWHDRFLGFMTEYMKSTYPDLGVVEVTSIWQDTDTYGGCDTCGYGSSGPTIDVSYKTEKGSGSITIDGDFGNIFGY